MWNNKKKLTKEFTEFRIGMEKQRLHGGRLSSSFLITYESGKLIAVETWLNPYGQLVEHCRCVWEFTGDELTLTNTVFVTEVLRFKRV
jgi:hypothetical protein